MTVYLVHKNFSGDPIGIWDETDSYYPTPNNLQKSAQTVMDSRYDNEPWEEFADRIADRISQRDWWDTYESNGDLISAYRELVPSDEPLPNI